MEFAINTAGERVHASDADKSEKYFCPLCHQQLLLRQGRVNVDHFAHIIWCEDPWHYDMSEWHSQWQAQFPVGNREVVVEHNGEKHRADVMACGYVIEFQHSPISAEEFEERNAFYRSYGKKVVWIFDFVSEYQQKQIECYDEWRRDGDNGGKYSWIYPKRFLQNYIPQKDKNVIVFFQLNEENHADTETAYMERVIWAIEEHGVSKFKRFQTSYYPGNAIELLDWIKNKKL